MKKYLFAIFMILFLPFMASGFAPQPPGAVSDTAYNEGEFDGVTTIAPSKNVFRDVVDGLAGGHDSVTLDVDADAILELATQQIGLNTQVKNTVFAGPTTGVDAVPTFRSLVPDDIPDISATYLEVSGALGTPSSGTLTNCSGLPNSGVIVITGENYANFTGCTEEADTLDELMTCINNTFAGVTFSALAGNLDQAEYYITEDEDSLTDSDAPSPNLSGKGTYLEFTDDGGTDVDNITGFTNFPADTNVWFRFEDAYWTVDFSEPNLYGHGELLWSPRAGDSMVCRSHDGTKIECIVSAPTALSISQFYKLPFDSTPDADDSWSGPTAQFLAGEALSQWDLVYIAHDTGTPEIKKWDADGAAKALKPIGVVTESGGIADTASGEVGVLWGIARNDGWTFTDNQDEGKTVYGLATTAGAIGVTAPAVSGDIVCAVGVVLDEDEILFNFGLCTSTEVP